MSDRNRQGITDTRGVKNEHPKVTVYLISELLQILGNLILHHLLLLHEGLWWVRADVFLLFQWLPGLSATRPFSHFLFLTWHCHLLKVLNLEDSPTQKRQSLIKPRLNLFCLNSKCSFLEKNGAVPPLKRTQWGCFSAAVQWWGKPESWALRLSSSFPSNQTITLKPQPRQDKRPKNYQSLHPGRVSGDLKKKYLEHPQI